MHFLLEDEFIELRIDSAVRIFDEVVEVFSYFTVDLILGISVGSENIVDFQDRDDVSPVLLGHVLDQILHLQHTTHRHLQAPLAHAVKAANDEHGFLVEPLAAGIEL